MKMIGPVDWAIILWVSVCRDLLAGGSGPKPMVPTTTDMVIATPIGNPMQLVEVVGNSWNILRNVDIAVPQWGTIIQDGLQALAR